MNYPVSLQFTHKNLTDTEQHTISVFNKLDIEGKLFALDFVSCVAEPSFAEAYHQRAMLLGVDTIPTAADAKQLVEEWKAGVAV